jgi:hypothetical protein
MGRAAVVSVKWAPQRSYRIKPEASFQIAAQRPSDRSEIRIKDAPRISG